MKIRRVKKEEISFLLKFEQELVEFERPFDSTLKEEKISYYDILSKINSKDSCVLVAEVNDKLVGSGFIDIVKAKPYLKHNYYGSLGFFYVKKEYRGRGVNKSILNGLIKWAKKSNIFEIRLQVYDKNSDAKSVYLKYGFEPTLLEMRLKI
tara:strand:- start:5375 stop:5827 length:453 start_codon:yes stop_codon:yes gene_type:complete